MSANDIVEWLMIGFFVFFYVVHFPVMGLVLKKNGGFPDRRLAVYTVVSILPLMFSAGRQENFMIPFLHLLLCRSAQE